MGSHDDLIEKYVACFSRLDEMLAIESIDPVAWQLATGPADEYGFKRWQPLRFKTEASALKPLYDRLPARFPCLFEELVLSYRWAEVDLQSYRLVANPAGPDLSGLLRNMGLDLGLWEALIPAGFIQFGKGADMDYDPICFDISSRNKSGDYRIVKIDHEEILCHNRIKVVTALASSFEQLVLDTIESAKTTGTV
jgi:hypothetical protein